MTVHRDKETWTWRYHFQIAHQRHSRRGFATRREAQAAEAEHRRRVLVGLAGTWPSFGALCEEYLSERAKRVSAAWVEQCLWKLNKHAAPLMRMQPREIRGLHVQRLLSGLTSAGMAARSVNEMRAILHAVFRWAEDMDAIDRNPVSRVGKLYVEPVARGSVSTAELRRLIVAASPPLRSLLIVQAVTGARWREIAELTPADVEIDADPPAVLLRTRKTGGRGQRVRRAHLPPVAVDAMRQAMQLASEHWVFPGRWPSVRVSYQTMMRQLHAATLRAGIDRVVGFHDVRRWAGTTAMEGGSPNTVVSRFLGHSKTTVTDLYMRVADPLMADVGERLAREISGAVCGAVSSAEGCFDVDRVDAASREK